MGRGPVQCREASSHQAAGRQVDASWSGRICTWPVLITDTRRIGSVTFISVFLRGIPGGLSPLLGSGCPSGRSRGGRRRPSPAPTAGGSMRFCTQIGGEVTRLSWRKCQKVAPSWSGLFGAPRGVVLPSATRPARASCHSLVCRAGRSSTTPSISAWSGVSLGVRDAGGDDDRLARSGHECSPLRVKWASPARMVKRSSWRGWMCSVITPPGTLRQLKRTSCPSLSSAMAV